MDAKELIATIVGMVAQTKGPVAIHGGNFFLHADPRLGRVYPMVGEELELLDAPEQLVEQAYGRYGIHATATFGWAAQLAATLRAGDRKADVCTLVTDWGSCVSAWDEPSAARAAFYRSYKESRTLRVFEEILKKNGLDRRALINMPTRMGLISETYIRADFGKRVKKALSKGQDGLELDGLSCSVDGVTLLDGNGSANCSGEVAELALRLHSRGYRALVLLYPNMCRNFIRASREVARELGLEGMTIITVPLPAGGERTEKELLKDLRIE
ncbi:MAG: hypothetical protein WCK01_00950 [Candidatus Uhrbacteria bacterium]